MNKICPICKKEFTPYNDRNIFCSQKCSHLNYERINKKELEEYYRKYRKLHKKETKKYNAKYQNLYKKELKEYHKNYHIKYYKKNKKEIKQYRDSHKKQAKELKRKWYLKNKVKIIKRIDENRRERMKTDLNFRIKQYLRTRIWFALKGICKSKHTIELLGCSIEQLKNYLEKQFKSGMSWSNYGYYGWHVDHIKPCCQFDFSKPSEQRKCFHYTNLQPLWAEENMKKHDR